MKRRVGYDTTYVPQSPDGVWLGTKRYPSVMDAVVAQAVNGGRLEILGDHALPDPLEFLGSGTHIVGGGPGVTRLTPPAGAPVIMTLGSKIVGAALFTWSISGIQFDGNSDQDIGLHLIGAQRGHLAGVEVIDLTKPGAIGIKFDTQSTGGYQACINNQLYSVFVNNCWHGVKFTKDGNDPGTDGCNHNSGYGLRVANFRGVGLDIDAGENLYFSQPDCSSSYAQTIGIRINDDVCTLDQPRADNSSGGGAAGASDAYGIYLTANARNHRIDNPSGNGPMPHKRIYREDPSIPGRVDGQSGYDTAQQQNTRRSLVATTQWWEAIAWFNGGGSTINAGELGYFNSAMNEGEIRRLNSAQTCYNPQVAIEKVLVGEAGGFALPGSVVEVACDAGAVAVGDQLVPSTTVNGRAKANNSNTNPRLRVGTARTSKSAGSNGTVTALV
jgi:hypothetical protein